MMPESTSDSPIAQLLKANAREVDGFAVGRALPQVHRRSVGPFVFVDHIGPSRLPPGQGLEVRPHPHINLATVTYLFDGEFLHRDSLGNEQVIEPGAINWMVAGHGIVHSERTPPAEREAGPKLHGIQLWVALPQASEEVEPSFKHHPAATLPEMNLKGAKLRILLGSAFGVTSPVNVYSPMFYVEAQLQPGATVTLSPDYAERALYGVEGTVTVADTVLARHDLAVFREGQPIEITATTARGEPSRTAARFMLLGGAPLDGPRYIWWNFVSSKKERITEAARAWKAGEFPKVFHDEIEFIPLNDDPKF
jgi:redox-sensitive bicupin YhaK (pirin superfamily)